MNVSSCGVKPVSTVCPATLAGGVAGTADERARHVVAHVELGHRHAEHLRRPAERLRERDGARRRILLEAPVEHGQLLLRAELVGLRDDRRGREHLEDLADVDVLVLVEEVLAPSASLSSRLFTWIIPRGR